MELTGIALNEHEITLEKGGNKVLEVQFTSENATNKLLTWASSNTSIVTVTDGIVVGVAPGSTEIIVKSGNFTDKCRVTVVISATTLDLDQTELSLSPGETATLKATVLPEDSTDEVEWSSSDEAIATVKDGEVEPKEDYSWSTYKWGTSSSNLTKYNTLSSNGTVDNKTVLDPEDDVARVKLGGSWRLPTDAEWTNLIEKCTWVWTDNYNGTGVSGRIVTATNGNSIFLPAAGSLLAVMA
ncbi:MAG: Ig-like domain-containing protein [Bacteroidales bacterium]|nr:Ig-like domain-containing protein [Bacteroidales bacterium]